MFLDDVVKGLTAPDGRVIPVRLSLFTEVVRHRPWTRATLKALGGVDGIGVKFLEDRFESDSSPHRLHKKAAQAILRALLPPPASLIRGIARTANELRTASGYADRPDDFDDLMRVLDHDLRLVAPSDPEGKEEAGRTTERRKEEGGRRNEDRGTASVSDSSFSSYPSSSMYYRLAHDYLIPSVRRWLDRENRLNACRSGSAPPGGDHGFMGRAPGSEAASLFSGVGRHSHVRIAGPAIAR